ncbi:hypothetical protein J5X84_33815 [Streptosporangiaceae bacterium NEAU-GS5]|nr:hypothetical protein [Streptosporangiaceae bacterium NEAU-GS5]
MTCGDRANTSTTAETSRSSPPPDGFPIWTSPVRPGREHDITCARAYGILRPLDAAAAEGLVTLADLGYEDAPAGIRLPYKKPKGGTLTAEQVGHNMVHRAVRALAERANAQLKMRFKVLRNISRNYSGA